MIVVSDTSPLNYLVLIGAIDVLPTLFTDVHTPPEVIAELLHPRTPDIVRLWAQSPPAWLHITRATLPPPAHPGLGAGETQAIALAKQLHAAYVLIDERDGTKAALDEGLTVIGTLAVLEQAASLKLLDLPTTLQNLTQTSFRISPALIRAALQRDALRRS